MSKSFTTNDVKEHGSVEKGLYIIIDNGVYEMGGFVDERTSWRSEREVTCMVLMARQTRAAQRS